MAEAWHVCTTGINQEALAEYGLKSKGFDVYCPIGKRVVRHARREMVRHYAVFSRYIFVRFDPDEPAYSDGIRSTDGIIDILCNNWEPMAIGDEVIEEIKERQSKGAFDRFPEKKKQQPRWSRSFEVLKNLLNVDVAVAA
jgi:transcription antitermination factor NusG